MNLNLSHIAILINRQSRTQVPIFFTLAPAIRCYARNIYTLAAGFRASVPNTFAPAPIARCYAPTTGAAVATMRIAIPNIRTQQFTPPVTPIRLVIYSFTIKNKHYENLC